MTEEEVHPGGYSYRVGCDVFGTKLEMQTCEYCQKTLPVKLWPNTIMHSYDYRGRISGAVMSVLVI